MTIYQPYFYIIQDTRNKKYYAGSKYGKDADPSKLMIKEGYCTSSKIILSLIEEFGLDIFIVRKIRTFEIGQDAYDYETKFLKRVNASTNENFYNKHENTLIAYHSEAYYDFMKEIYGVKYPMQSKDLYEKSIKTKIKKYGNNNNIEKIKSTFMSKYGVENAYQVEEVKNKIKDSNIEKLGVPYPMMSKICKEKSKETSIKNHGVENVAQSPEIQKKMKFTCINRYGVENPYQSESIKEKSKETLIRNYGVDHPMYSEEIKNKLIETNMIKYGVKNTFQSELAKNKIKEKIDILLNRPQLSKIREYQRKFKLKFGQGWVRKSDIFINDLLKNLEETYGFL